MAAVNQFKPFAANAGANVLTQAEYEALGARATGFSSGIAESKQLNKAWRQSSVMAAAVAQHVANQLSEDVLDDGNLSNLTDQVRRAFRGPVDDLWFQPTDLDLTGVSDESTKVAGYLAAHRRVMLPAGTIKMDILVPSGCSLLGAGPKVWNSLTSAWEGNGTLIKGRVKFDDQRGWTAGMFSVDGVAAGLNPIQAVGPLTRFGYLSRINTRANDHGFLLEQKGTNPVGDFNGDIIIEDCIHVGGPNGFVAKMSNVEFRRCFAYEVSVQAFVAASDNIVAAGTYSRAMNVRFIDCGGGSNGTMLRVYSRDHFSLDNSNGVMPASNIQWIRGDLSGCIQNGAHVGDPYLVSPGFSYINPEDVDIDEASVILNGAAGILVTRGTRVRISNSKFGDNAGDIHIDFDMAGDRVIDLDYSEGNFFYNGMAGKETGVLDLDKTSGALDARKGFSLFRTNSTAELFISSVTGGRPGQRFAVLIQDDFTTVAIDAARPVRGKGVLANFVFDAKAGAWRAESIAGNYEAFGTLTGGTLALDFSGANTTSLIANLGAAVTAMTVTKPSTLAVGKPFGLRLKNTAGASLALTWSAYFKFADGITAATSIAASKQLLLELYWDGANLVVTRQSTY